MANEFYYAVYHCWEKDHYNAQVWVNDLLCVFDSLEKAEEFKKKYENRQIVMDGVKEEE